MPPYQPVFSISRSQAVRIGLGPGNTTVSELNSGDLPTNPQTGALITPTYIDLGNPLARRDYQHHNAIGALVDFPIWSTVAASASPLTSYTDLFGTGFAVTNGSGFALNIAAGVIQSRYSGAQIAIPASTTLTTPGAPVYGTRTDLVVVNNAGVVSVIPGPTDSAAPVYDVITLSSSAAITGGAFYIGFTYNGFWFKTASLSNALVGSTLASAILAATGGPFNAALSAWQPSAATAEVGGGASALSTGAVSLTATAAGGLEGPLQNVQLLNNTATGGTLTLTHTTSGTGVTGPKPNGNFLILAAANTAVAAASATLSTSALMQTS